MGARRATGPDQPENLVLQPRNVEFDWSDLATHWVPGEPMVTHTVNVLHPACRRAEGGRIVLDL